MVSSWTDYGVYDPWSNCGSFISTMQHTGRFVCQKNIGDWGRQRDRPVQVMCELVTRSKRWNPPGSRLETEERGSRSDKWRLMWKGLLKFDKNPKLGHGFCSASQECTLLSRGILRSLFLAPQLELNRYNPFIGLWCYRFMINHLWEKVSVLNLKFTYLCLQIGFSSSGCLFPIHLITTCSIRTIIHSSFDSKGSLFMFFIHPMQV